MKRIFLRLFVPLAAVLYAVFLILDLTSWTDSDPVKYAALLLCVLAALCGQRGADGAITAAALVFTAAADVFLLFFTSHLLVGVLLFWIVQGLYAVRLFRWRHWQRSILFSVRLLPFISFFSRMTPLFAAALVYFVNIVINLIECGRLPAQNVQTKLFTAGLMLFVCCDICVGAWNLNLLPHISHFLIWVFYLPAQVLIALSSMQKESAA